MAKDEYTTKMYRVENIRTQKYTVDFENGHEIASSSEPVRGCQNTTEIAEK